jgi:nitrogen fixation/metabolism regulation signal transduction histidine kinase
MRPVCAIGLAPSLSDHVLLSESAGIGGFLMRTGRVLRRSSREAAHPQMRQEFDLLGVEVALPILGRDGLIGAAMLDSRVTGESLTNGELETVFHLLEQVGMALSNIRLHDQIVGSNQLLGEVLRELASACVVVAPDLSVLHVNKSARRALGGASARRSGSFEFADLPEQLGSKVYQVIKTGAGLPSFRYEPADGTRRVFDVSLMPIHGAGAAAGACSALLVMEDRTQADHLQRLEKEADQLRLVRNMADRLAAEIGNAITPLSAYQQLLGERLGRKGDEFLGSLNSAMADGVKRVQRLINQMRYIYREEGAAPEAVKLGPLLEEAFEDARRHHNGKSARMVFDERVKTVQVAGERAALRHALSEILLNGLLASPQDPRIEVRMVEDVRGNGHEEVGIDIVDGGQGFSPTALARGCEPFFTEKSVGAGLGLTAAKKIVDAQLGRLELRQGPHGIVRILLPSEPHKA